MGPTIKKSTSGKKPLKMGSRPGSAVKRATPVTRGKPARGAMKGRGINKLR